MATIANGTLLAAMTSAGNYSELFNATVGTDLQYYVEQSRDLPFDKLKERMLNRYDSTVLNIRYSASLEAQWQLKGLQQDFSNLKKTVKSLDAEIQKLLKVPKKPKEETA